jgi:hypothetical protein
MRARTTLLVLVAAAEAAGCGTPKQRTAPRDEGPRCVSYDEAKLEEKAVAERNEAHFQRALAEQGLREPGFDADYFDARDDQGHEWQVVDAAGARTLLAPPSYMTCGEIANPWRLAQDGSGAVSALVVTPREAAASKVITICGCQADVPITCGGAAPQPVRWRWAMSPTATWKGPLAIVVDHESVSTTFAGRTDGSRCPDPMPPP